MNEFRKQLDYIRELYGSVENYLAKEFGEGVPFSIVGDFCLVHLDLPVEAEIRRRESEFDPAEHFPDDCPICEMQRETGGFIIFDQETDEEIDDEDAEFENNTNSPDPLPPLELPQSIWRRSYLNLNGLANAQAELKVTILLQNIWGNIVELKEDCAGRSDETAALLAFEEAYRPVAKATRYYLDVPGHWQELKSLYARAHTATSGIRVDQCEEKVQDLRRKMEALEKFFLEVLTERILKRIRDADVRGIHSRLSD